VFPVFVNQENNKEVQPEEINSLKSAQEMVNNKRRSWWWRRSNGTFSIRVARSSY